VYDLYVHEDSLVIEAGCADSAAQNVLKLRSISVMLLLSETDYAGYVQTRGAQHYPCSHVMVPHIPWLDAWDVIERG
jgi:hypothetical protein